MRFLILGAGATGGYFGGRLVKAGVDVSYLVRPRRKEQLAEHGLKVESGLGNFEVHPRAITREEIDQPYDVVILSPKAFDLAAAIESIRPAVGRQTLVLPLLNGMRHLDDLDKEFGAERVLGGTCHISVVMAEDGTIRHLSPFASMTQGARSESQKDRAKEIHAELSRGGFDARLADDVVGAMWEKWVLLATLAGSTCLMRGSIGEISATDAGVKFISDMLDECDAVAAASGHQTRSVVISAIRSTLTDRASNISASMLRDIQRNGPVEADHIIGDLVKRGADAGIPTPLLRIAYTHLQVYQNRWRNLSKS